MGHKSDTTHVHYSYTYFCICTLIAFLDEYPGKVMDNKVCLFDDDESKNQLFVFIAESQLLIIKCKGDFFVTTMKEILDGINSNEGDLDKLIVGIKAGMEYTLSDAMINHIKNRDIKSMLGTKSH